MAHPHTYLICSLPLEGKGREGVSYSTVTLFAKFRGWSTSRPRSEAM